MVQKWSVKYEDFIWSFRFPIKLGGENKNPHILPTVFVSKSLKMQKVSLKYEYLYFPNLI